MRVIPALDFEMYSKTGGLLLLRASFSSLVLFLLLLCVESVELQPITIKAATSSFSSSFQSLEAPLNRTEVVTLLALRGVLGIRSRYWPRKTDPCTVWTGIVCENGHVVSITLTGLRRTVKGALRPVFAVEPLQNLTYLRSFNSSGFSLPGSIPDWFGTLSTLQQLDLSSSSVTSVLPSTLGNLSNLQTLAISVNNISGSIPSSLGNLSKLTSLDLSSNNLSGPIPETLTSLQSLQILNLAANLLVGQITPGFANLLNLQSLLLGSNGLQGSIPSEMGGLSLLRNLDLSSNALSGPIPSSLGMLSSLVSLTLSSNSLNGTIPAELSNCTALQVLSLDRNALSGSLPTSLGLLRNISTLSLSSNNLTGSLPTGFSGFTQAQQILLSNNLFYGFVPFVTANLARITAFDLSENYFEGSIPVPFVSVALLDANCFLNQPNQRSTDICKRFYADRGLPFEETQASAVPTSTPIRRSKHLVPILAGVFGGLGFVIIVMAMVCVFFVLRKKKKREVEQKDTAVVSRGGAPPPPSEAMPVNLLSLGENFSYAQLLQATGEFSQFNFMKAGHSGDLYQGILEGGLAVVVKRIELAKYKKDGYLAELDLFGKASHTRLVPLLGHCFERDDEKLLVYKYMPGRDLGFTLHKKNNGNPSEDTLPSLDWITRLKIAIGTAEGLTYLHNECTPALVHRDIQASSILLDDKFEVRLGSLTEACVAVGEPHPGVISRILRRSQTSEHGDAGAAAPTCAYDVYCFGKVLLELVSGRLGISGSTDPSTDAWLEWALAFINVYDKEALSKIVDPSLIVDEDLMEEVWAMAIVAKSCLNPKPSKRPLMRYILKALENPLKVVREDRLNGSGRSHASSHGSWNAALFGSWRHSSSETVVIPGSLREEYLQKNSSKQATNGGSQGSGQGEVSQRRPGSSEIFPEPLDESVAPAPTNANSDKQDS
eukprot:c16672_g1_i1 orf=394-3222(-)